MRKFCLLLILVSLGAWAKAPSSFKPRVVKSPRPKEDYKVHNIGQIWTMESNFGSYGHPGAGDLGVPSFDWPGGTFNYYLYEGGIWVGAKIGDDYYVSTAFYDHELQPSDKYPDGWGFCGGGPEAISMYDITSAFDDFDENANANRGLGLCFEQKALAWSLPDYDDFIIYYVKIWYEKDKALIGAPPDVLENVYVSVWMDADVSNADPSWCHIDDLVSYDGWTNGEWEASGFFAHIPHVSKPGAPVHFPYDSFTIIGDTIFPFPDGAPDYYTIWGDDPDEFCLTRPDTVYLREEVYKYLEPSIKALCIKEGNIYKLPCQLIERNMSYIYDGDNPADPGDDEGNIKGGEGIGACAGYFWGRVLYAPPSPNDSVWSDGVGECRRVRPNSHSWWNWENDPGTDEEQYKYMAGVHEANYGYRFMPHPFDVGAPTFDYRFLLTYGSYELRSYVDTLVFVFAIGVGQGLNGGVDSYWGRGWEPGARQMSDLALKAYYMGRRDADPLHPAPYAPGKNFVIPLPPEVPSLRYTVCGDVVELMWDDRAEKVPDPMDNILDFGGYRVYRSDYKVGNWVLLADFPKKIWGDTIPHSYVDTPPIGVPVYYAVTAYDTGRLKVVGSDTIRIEPLESGKINYKKDEEGKEIAVWATGPEDTTLKMIRVVPNPYLATARWERQFEDKIMFVGLPPECRIEIFTVSGDLVKVIEHNNGTGSESWDLVSRGDIEVSSGLYIYKVTWKSPSGKLKHKFGKFVIIRGETR